MEKEVFVLAGGTGLIGTKLREYLENLGHEVRILSRQKTNSSTGVFHWNPAKKELDENALVGMTRLVNLSGAGIADKRWTKKRKWEIINSRVEPTLFLAEKCKNHPTLKHYVSASGINCYDTNFPEKIYVESDPIASDYLSEVVRDWEQVANSFLPICPVSKIRISVVLTPSGGALAQMAMPFKFHFGAALGSGKQWLPWIHYKDLIRMIEFISLKNEGDTYNALGENVSNKYFMKTLGKSLKKPIWLPNLPGFILKIALGEMASMLLKGIQASNQKIKNKGFVFEYEKLENAFKSIYK